MIHDGSVLGEAAKRAKLDSASACYMDWDMRLHLF